eukprot:3042669-Rhodomonas_salina.4
MADSVAWCRGNIDIVAAKKQLAQEAKYQIAGKANPFEVISSGSTGHSESIRLLQFFTTV